MGPVTKAKVASPKTNNFSELDTISQWLDAAELEIESFGPLAADSSQALRQIELHTKFQQKLNDFQETIDKLESFVAVVGSEAA